DRGRGLLSGNQGQQFVETTEVRARFAFLDQLVEPGEMREQQASIEAAPAADQLAAVIDRFLHALDRAVGEDLLGTGAGPGERQRPAAREKIVAAAQPVRGFGRKADAQAGGADVALGGEVIEEPCLALGRPAAREVRGLSGDGRGVHDPRAPHENKTRIKFITHEGACRKMVFWVCVFLPLPSSSSPRRRDPAVKKTFAECCAARGSRVRGNDERVKTQKARRSWGRAPGLCERQSVRLLNAAARERSAGSGWPAT